MHMGGDEIDLHKAVDDILPTTLDILKRDRSHAPMLFVFGEVKSAAVVFDLPDPEDKPWAMFETGKKFSFVKPAWVMFVSEAWMSRRMPPEGKYVYDMPDKEEVIQIVAQGKDGDILAVTIPFTRVGRDIVFGERMESSEVESHLLDQFWKGVSHM